MTRKLRMIVNNRIDHAEHDWLIVDEHNQVVTGFAGSNAAERFLRDAEMETRIESCVSHAERRRLARLIPAAID